MHDETLYSFGPFALDAGQRVLRRGGEAVRLTPREADVLVALVERHGELVEKSRFFDQVWRGLAVEECNLSQHVAALRRALHDDARVPTYIETVPRRGYRFVAPVARVAASSAPAPAPLPTPAPLPAYAPIPALAPVLATTPVAPTPVRAVPPGDVRRGVLPPGIGRRALALAGAAVAIVAALAGATAWGARHRASRAAAGRAIVVQPFANLTGDAHQDALAETLTAELLKDLRAIEGLRVDPASLPATDGEAARADAVVETSLLGVGSRVRLTAELIDARTRRLLWAEAFEADPISFLETEDRVAAAIAARLAAGLDDGPADASARADAQRECALAREYLGRRTPHVVREAVAHFTAAAERDPGYAPAYAGVAEAYLLGIAERVLAPDDALARAEDAARRALALDPRSAEAHAALGEIAAARWDFDAADASYRRALGLDPSIAAIHESYSALLTVRGQHDRAVEEAHVARDLAPTCAGTATSLAAAYYHSGRNEAAIEQALLALRASPGFAAAYDVLGWAHQAMGDDAESLAAFQEAVRLSGRSPTYVAALARAHARAGARTEARTLLADLERQARERRASPLDLAEVLAALGETDRAVRQVERAVADGAPWLQHVDAGLGLAALHENARFRAVVDRMRARAAVGAGREASAAEAARTSLPGAAALADSAR